MAANYDLLACVPNNLISDAKFRSIFGAGSRDQNVSRRACRCTRFDISSFVSKIAGRRVRRLNSSTAIAVKRNTSSRLEVLFHTRNHPSKPQPLLARLAREYIQGGVAQLLRR